MDEAETAEIAFATFKDKWGKKHPVVIQSWENNWLESTTYYRYPHEIRRMIYTPISSKDTIGTSGR
jgi:putative transposase